VSLKRLTVIPLQLFGPKEIRHEARLWLGERAMPLLACILYVLVPMSLATFPGEPHLNLLTGEPLTSVQCGGEGIRSVLTSSNSGKRWLPKFDRLTLSNADIVDPTKLARIEEATEKAGEQPFQGERTRILGNRDLNCSVLNDADLRRVGLKLSSLIGANLDGTRLEGADLSEAKLLGASIVEAELQGANLSYAKLQGAELLWARLQGANLVAALLQGADLNTTHLQGADLSYAKLQGADLRLAGLQGAGLHSAHLQGAILIKAQLQGADLSGAQLQGADLRGAQLQGANLVEAQLQAADLSGAQLQGADFSAASLDHSVLFSVGTWRAQNAHCANARVVSTRADDIVAVESGRKSVKVTPATIDEFINDSIAQIPNTQKTHVAARMRKGLVADPAKDDTEAISRAWSDCEKAETSTMPRQKFDEQRAAVLRDLVCNEQRGPGALVDDENEPKSDNREAIAAGITQTWISTDQPSVFSVQLAGGLLGEDGKGCGATKDFDNATIGKLKEAAAAKVTPAATPTK
jgi:uncharacterized protein YjbI with pentapeptide repeats